MANDAQLNILIKARNEAKGEFDKLNKQVNQLQGKTGGGGLKGLSDKFKSATGMSLGFATAAGAAGLAAQKLFQFLQQTVAETEKYVMAMVDGARVTGMAVEDYSRLTQAADDLFISQEKLQAGLLAATRQGIDVSTEGLKKLSEEYLALNPVAARGEFLMKKFGRSGSDMGKLLEIGADGIDAATKAIADNLIVTGKSQRDIENYKRSIDTMNDAWQGVKYTVGSEVIPILTAVLDLINGNMTETQKLTDAQVIFNLVGIDTASVIDTVGKAMGASAEEIAEVQAQLVGINETAPTTSKELATLAGEVSDTSQYFKDLTREMVFNKLAAGMDAEAQMQLAMQMGLVNWETYSTLTALDELTAKYDTNGDGVITLKEKTAEYNIELSKILGYQNALKDKTVTYKVRIIDASQNLTGDTPNNPFIGLTETNKAIGGPVQAGIPVQVNELGQEIFIPDTNGTIIPHNQLGNSGGGQTVNVYLNYSPSISLSDRTEVMTKLKPLILEALRG